MNKGKVFSCLLLCVLLLVGCSFAPIERNPVITIENNVEYSSEIIGVGVFDSISSLNYVEIGDVISNKIILEGISEKTEFDLIPGKYQIIFRFEDCPYQFASNRTFLFELNKKYKIEFVGYINHIQHQSGTEEYVHYLDTLVSED